MQTEVYEFRISFGRFFLFMSCALLLAWGLTLVAFGGEIEAEMAGGYLAGLLGFGLFASAVHTRRALVALTANGRRWPRTLGRLVRRRAGAGFPIPPLGADP